MELLVDLDEVRVQVLRLRVILALFFAIFERVLVHGRVLRLRMS